MMENITPVNTQTIKQKWAAYKKRPASLIMFMMVVLAAVITVSVFLIMVGYILINGIPHLKPELFEWTYTSDNVSMMPAIINTIIITLLTLLIAVPLGIFSAIYLVEYAKRGNKFVSVVRITTETLSGIPSIVYGLFGFLMFVISFRWSYTLLGGALTLAIMILPLIMRTTEEALKSVPDSFREGSFGLGAGKLRTIFKIILPSAVPGILSGIILAIGRIVGETAALIFSAGTVTGIPKNLMGSGRTLAVHMYALMNEGLHTDEANATAVILLIFVAGINILSGIIARKLTKR